MTSFRWQSSHRVRVRFPACCLGLAGLLALAPLVGQTVKPARPVDPNQAMPAQPLEPISPLPPPPTNSTSGANEPDAATAQASLSIIADSSLRQVLQELAQTWADNQDSNPKMPLTLTNAGTIRAKVESGAAWDVVITADIADLKEMTGKGLLMAADQQSLARNTLVVYGRSALIKDDELEWFDLVGTEWKKVAIGNPDLVESGRVAKHALEKHDLMNDDHKNVFIFEGSESLAVHAAEREQVDAVFVYPTDLATVKLPGFEVYPIKNEDAPPVFYTAAISSLAKNTALAHSFIDYCGSDAAKEIWKKYGFETN